MTKEGAARTILLVEDSDDHAELVRRILTGRLAKGTVLVRVRDGVEAKDYLSGRGNSAGRSEPELALVIVDLRLPRHSGLELLAELRQSPVFRELPAVVLTTSRAEIVTVRELGYPASAYLFKPLRVCELFKALREYGTDCVEQCLAMPARP